MTIKELQQKEKILIVGYGIEGRETEAFLKKHAPHVEIKIVDEKDGPLYLEKQREYDLAIKSPGVKSELLTIPFTTATNIFFSIAKGKIIGVTGTKGKSTTTSLIFEVLKTQGFDVHLGGNIGIPPLSFLDVLQDDSISVLELSSFQLADVTSSPHIAVMLMTAPEHLDYHSDIISYVEAKRNILRFQSSSDYAVLNADYPATRESDLLTDAHVYWAGDKFDDFGKQGCFIHDNELFLRMDGKEEKIINRQEIALQGRHNLENICAATVASLLAGATIKSILPVLKTFKGLPYRLEYVSHKNGVTYYNDSLATIPEATIGAIEALGDDVETLIAGGHDRGIDYQEFGKFIAKSQVKNLILFPETGSKIWEAVVSETSESVRPQVFEVVTMEEAVRLAAQHTSRDRICLMSPAASSFGIFKNYKDRGDQFKDYVNNLK